MTVKYVGDVPFVDLVTGMDELIEEFSRSGLFLSLNLTSMAVAGIFLAVCVFIYIKVNDSAAVVIGFMFFLNVLHYSNAEHERFKSSEYDRRYAHLEQILSEKSADFLVRYKDSSEVDRRSQAIALDILNENHSGWSFK